MVHPVFHIELLKDGSSVRFDVKATPTLLQLKCSAGEMAQKSGMSENYDAQSGAALRDPAYTWTSSVYLLFAHKLWRED